MISRPAALKPFNAVVFDMDGTLLDTELVFRDVVFEITEVLGFPMTEAVHLSMVGTSHEATNAILLETYGADFPHELFQLRCREAMSTRMAEAVPLKTGAREILEELKRRGVPLAVATSSRRHHADSHLGTAGLLDLFETIITRDDVENPKPHPEPYLRAAAALGVPPAECLAIEDSHTGVQAAHAAGMQTIMVPDLVRPSDAIAALGVAVLDSLHHVREALPQHEALVEL